MATITTPLTGNCNSVTTNTGAANESTTVAFMYQGITLWQTLLSNTNPSVTTTTPFSAGPVTLDAGANVSLSNVDPSFNVLFTGTIVDSGSASSFVGTNIGTFPSA